MANENMKREFLKQAAKFAGEFDQLKAQATELFERFIDSDYGIEMFSEVFDDVIHLKTLALENHDGSLAAACLFSLTGMALCIDDALQQMMEDANDE